MSNEPDDRPWRRTDEDYPERRDDRPQRSYDPPIDDQDAYAGRGKYQEPHRGMVILILGILGFAVCGICGIVAYFMGKTDLQKMDAGRMDPEGRGLTQAGKIMGLISMILMAVSLILMVGMFAVFFVIGAGAAPAPAPRGNNPAFQPAPVVAPNR